MKIKLSRKVRHESKVADDEVKTREPEVERNARKKREKNWIVNRSSSSKTTIEWLAPIIITHAYNHTHTRSLARLHARNGVVSWVYSIRYRFLLLWVTVSRRLFFCYRMHVCGSLIYIYILQSNPLIHRQFCVGGGVAACERIHGVPCNFKPISNRIWNAIFFDSSVSSSHTFAHINANTHAYACRRLNWFALCLFDFAYSFAVAHWHNFLSSICAVE